MFQTKQGKAKDPSYKLNQAQSLHQAGYLLEAKAIYIELVNEHPQSYFSLNGLAYILLQTGQLAEGIALLRKSLKINSDQVQVLSLIHI